MGLVPASSSGGSSSTAIAGDVTGTLGDTTVASIDSVVVSLSGGSTGETIVQGSGGSFAPGTPLGMTVVRGPFTFTHATANLNAGVAVYTPTVGDVLLDAWIEIDTEWNALSVFDFGTFNGGNSGVFAAVSQGGVTLPGLNTGADGAIPDNAGLLGANIGGATLAGAWGLSYYTIDAGGIAHWQIKFTAANPLLVVVSQNGAKGGTASTATAGSSSLYLVTATPHP